MVGVASETDVIVLDAAPDPAAALADDPRRCSTSTASPASSCTSAGDRLTLVVSRENLHAEAQVRDGARAHDSAPRVRIADTLGAISVVGAGINASFDNVRRGLGRATGSGATIDGIATSSFRITWMIDRARLDDAVRLLHHAS